MASRRDLIGHLLDESDPADASAAYYAFYHEPNRTRILTTPTNAEKGRARGYVALSQTGIDLFRPLVTMRLPADDMASSVELIHSALRPGAAVILNSEERDRPLLQALFDVHSDETLELFVLDRRRFEPIINVLVTSAESHNGLPRFVVRRGDSHVHATESSSEIVASAGLNWQSPTYAEISVNTDPRHRRRGWGRSVVAALIQHLTSSGRTLLYLVTESNSASRELAKSVGFVDSGVRQLLMQATLRARPD